MSNKTIDARLRAQHKRDEDIRKYYESIQITPSEYVESLAQKKRHHQHDLRFTKAHVGVIFVNCECGFHDVVMPERPEKA